MKKKLLVCFVIILIIVLCPIVVELFTNKYATEKSSYETWVNFWGVYIGSILGGIITLFVMYSTIMNEKKEIARKEKTEYFDTIIKLVSEYESKAAKLSACIYGITYGKNNSIKSAELTNELSKESIELDLYLKIHKQYLGIKEFSIALDKTDQYINKMNDTIEGRPKDKNSIPELRESVDYFQKNILVELQNETVKYAKINYK